MISLILSVTWYFLPAAIANMTARLSYYLPKFMKPSWMEKPVDGGLMINSKPFLGKNKTIRGVFYATLFATLTGFLQALLILNTDVIQNLFDLESFPVEYTVLTGTIFGFLLGLGAMLGDMAESFIKRQINIPSGRPFPPFDQTDFIIGSSLLGLFIARFDSKFYITLFLTFFFGHLVIKFLGYKIGVDKAPI
jgi:CDP-diglyceride synthetase